MMTMKGIGPAFLWLAVLGAGARPVTAQADVTWGPRFGVGVHAVLFEDPATDGQTYTLPGLHAGVAVARKLGGPLSVEVDVLLSREGFRGRGAHTGDLKRDLLVVPVLLRVEAPRVPLHLTAGASAKLGLRCVRADVALVGSMACDDPVMGDQWANTDLAGLVGLGASVSLGGRTLVGDVLLSWGLRDLNRRLFVPGGARSISLGASFALLSPWGAAHAGGAS